MENSKLLYKWIIKNSCMRNNVDICRILEVEKEGKDKEYILVTNNTIR